MPEKRPYFGSSIEELESLFAANKTDLKMLKKLQKELSFRKRPRARKLHTEISAIIAGLLLQKPCEALSSANAATQAPYVTSHINLEKMPAASVLQKNRQWQETPHESPLNNQNQRNYLAILLAALVIVAICVWIYW